METVGLYLVKLLRASPEVYLQICDGNSAEVTFVLIQKYQFKIQTKQVA